MKKIIFFCLLLNLFYFTQSKVLAIPARVVYSKDAQGLTKGISLKVTDGYGLTINFIETGESVKQAWLADPSHIGFSSNGNLCQLNQNNCKSSGATILFLRKIKPINFPHLTSSKNGSTQLTIITQGNDGKQKEYQFRLVPSVGEPAYTSLVIKPDSERPLPLLLKRSIELRKQRQINKKGTGNGQRATGKNNLFSAPTK